MLNCCILVVFYSKLHDDIEIGDFFIYKICEFVTFYVARKGQDWVHSNSEDLSFNEGCNQNISCPRVAQEC